MMSPEEIRKEIADGKISAITLDTTVFDRNALKLDTGLLKALEQFKDTSVNFLLSQVVTKEVSGHLKSKLAEVHKDLSVYFDHARKYFNISDEKICCINADLFGGVGADDEARKRVSEFYRKTGCQIVRPDDRPILGQITQRYFDCKPPFSNKKDKKHEFPDAIAILSLEAWAKENHTKMLVVSADDGWISYCNESENLVPVKELSDALNYFHKDISFRCELLSLRVVNDKLENLNEAILSALNDKIDLVEFSIEASSAYSFDEEVVGVTAKDYRFCYGGESGALKPIGYSKGALTVEAVLEVHVSVDCSFSFSIWDGLDKEYCDIGSNIIAAEKEIEVRIVITVADGLGENPKVVQVDVIPGSATINFGDIEPDWGEPDDEPEWEDPDWDEPEEEAHWEEPNFEPDGTGDEDEDEEVENAY